jgi:uncharacterized protein YqgV (UPF0045/DUF77 family)
VASFSNLPVHPALPRPSTFQGTIRRPSVDVEGKTLPDPTRWCLPENQMDQDGTSTNPTASGMIATILNISLERAVRNQSTAAGTCITPESWAGSAKLIAKGRIACQQTCSKGPNKNIRIKIRKSNLHHFQTFNAKEPIWTNDPHAEAWY